MIWISGNLDFFFFLSSLGYWPSCCSVFARLSAYETAVSSYFSSSLSYIFFMIISTFSSRLYCGLLPRGSGCFWAISCKLRWVFISGWESMRNNDLASLWWLFFVVSFTIECVWSLYFIFCKDGSDTFCFSCEWIGFFCYTAWLSLLYDLLFPSVAIPFYICFISVGASLLYLYFHLSICKF